ncbi:MAG: Gfo/Idh/MocA family oxidoreductase [Chloroflexi bacterium]|nr:Gfo/Idh/MocA family oxidoreductase [Chloroflexota bacterium]
MIRIGVIGCGGMGTHHAKVLASMPGRVQVVGVCDTFQDKADKLGALLNVPAYADYHDLFPVIDAAFICTPPTNRLDVVTDCAAAKKQIFAEKTLALSLAEADQMVAAADRAGVRFMIGYVLRYTQPYRYLRDVLDAGQVGRLVNCWTRRYMPADMTTRWYGDQSLSGGVLLDFGCHDVDMMYWLGGKVRSVFAHFDKVRDAMRADEHAQVLMTFVNGGMASVDVSWSSFATENTLGITGTQGTVVLDRYNTLRKKLADWDCERLPNPMAEKLGPPQESIQEHFVRCLEQDLEPLTTAQQARDVLAIILAAQESGRTGKSVDLA